MSALGDRCARLDAGVDRRAESAGWCAGWRVGGWTREGRTGAGRGCAVAVEPGCAITTRGGAARGDGGAGRAVRCVRPKWGRVWAGCVVAERACRDRDAVIVSTVTRKAAPGGRTGARSSIRGKHLQRGDRTPRLTASRPPCEPSRSFARGFACARVRSLERACGGMAALSARESVAQDAQTSGGWDRRRRR